MVQVPTDLARRVPRATTHYLPRRRAPRLPTHPAPTGRRPSRRCRGNPYANSWLWTKAAVLAAVAFGAYAALLWGGFPGDAMLALAVLAAVAALLLGINLGHDAAHDALTSNRVVDSLLQQLSFTLIGADAYLWRVRHVRSHHVLPNVNGCDLDIDENPFLRLSPNHQRPLAPLAAPLRTVGLLPHRRPHRLLAGLRVPR